MIDTSNVGSVERAGLERLNPRQIARKLFLCEGQPVSVLDATDEQFEAFRIAARIPVSEKEEGKRWSWDNRCRAINHALKYGLKLPFVEEDSVPIPNKNNSEETPRTGL